MFLNIKKRLEEEHIYKDERWAAYMNNVRQKQYCLADEVVKKYGGKYVNRKMKERQV